VGDKLLIALSKRLLKTVRSNDLIAHFGGDEFVIILENNKTPTDVAVSADRILQQVHTPFYINKTEHFIDASIGIASFPNDAQTAEGLIQAANTAMYIAKKSGNNYEFYDRSLSDHLVQEMTLMSKLRDAVGSDQFVLNYQPQFYMKNGRIIGFEALVRWNHPEMGIVSPVRFIPIAEKTRLIIPLGEQILIEACRQMNEWHHKTGFNGRIAVNVSAVQVEHSNFIKTLEKALAITGLDPNLLEIEITESSAMKNPSMFIELFRQIRKMGAHIAIDDFGTGYSSLSYLKRFPLDKLKIDKSFVDDLPHDKDACAIARTIIDLAKNLGMSTLAEGVETPEQADYLIRHGCIFVQGYLYGKPLVTREAEKRLSGK